MFPDHDAGLGIAAAVRAGEDLEHVLTELHGIVIGHGALVGEAADVIEDLCWDERSICDMGIGGGLRKACIVAREEAGQDGVGLLEGAGPRPAQFTDEAILQGAPEAFDPAFGLRGSGRDPADAQLLEGAADVGERARAAAQLLIERQRLAGRALEDAVAIAVDCDRAALGRHQRAQDPEIAVGIFLVTEEGGRHQVGGVVDGAVEDQARAPAFQPVVVAGIELDEQARLGHALAPAAMPTGPPGAWAGQTRSHEPAMDRPVGQQQPMVLDERFGQVLVIKAGIGRAGEAEDATPERIGEAVVGRAAAIPMGQDGGAMAAEGGQQAASVAQREAEESSGL